MHIEKNMCKSLLRTLLNMVEETRDHGYAQVDLKKMEIRPNLCLDDLVKGTELPTSCITISKNEKEFCGFLICVKVPFIQLLDEHLKVVSLSDLKIALSVMSHDYHILLMQMIVVGIQNILLVNVREAIINFYFSSMQLVKKY
jgi:hypothetical protein